MTPTRARSIPFFDYPNLFTSEEEALVGIFRDVGRRGAFIMQQDLEHFERRLAAYLGVKYATGVANASDGLLIALRAAGVTSGEVIFSSHTMVATAAAIHFAGATPIPVECGADHLIDPAAVEAAVTSCTRAILPTQLNGRTADMGELQAIADRHGLLLIEDAAQALGSRFRGRAAASFGVASNQRRYFRNHSDIQWFRRALICQKCGHQWLTAELPEEFLNELVQLRNALKEVKANAEAYIQESERAADGLKRLSASLSALRALNVYEKE